ncbi:MAG: hypothetical protein A4E53_03071 [Pelotomaculum sp. PtaB.Bin104]|nr:MAG: hypothetical protein A4E53_03071 [Pelotomaculum sp. PtaB.Bin104]
MEVAQRESTKDELLELLQWMREYYGLQIPEEVLLSVAEKIDSSTHN